MKMSKSKKKTFVAQTVEMSMNEKTDTKHWMTMTSFYGTCRRHLEKQVPCIALR